MDLAGLTAALAQAVQGPLPEMASSQRNILDALGRMAHQSDHHVIYAQQATMEHISSLVSVVTALQEPKDYPMALSQPRGQLKSDEWETTMLPDPGEEVI